MRKLVTQAALARAAEPPARPVKPLLGTPAGYEEWCLMRWSERDWECGPVGQDVWTITRFRSKEKAVAAIGLGRLDIFIAPMSALKFTLTERMAAGENSDGVRMSASESVVYRGSYGEALEMKAARIAVVEETGDPLMTSYLLTCDLTDDEWIPKQWRGKRPKADDPFNGINRNVVTTKREDEIRRGLEGYMFTAAELGTAKFLSTPKPGRRSRR